MNAMEFQKNISVSMMHAFGYFSILYRKRSCLYFDFLHNFNGPGLCSAKRILPKLSGITMSKGQSFLDQISDAKETRRIRVRICRMWKAVNKRSGNNFISLDMIFIDEKENLMHAIVRKNVFQKFSAILHEGGTFIISNFKVIVTNKGYRPVSNDLNIIFLLTTSVKECNEESELIPMHAFEFATYNCINNRLNDNSYLTDLIGKLTAVGPIEQVHFDSGSTNIRNLHILLPKDKELKISLWDESAETIIENDFKEDKGPYIIIVTSTTVKAFQGKLNLNTTSASKVYVNLDITEVSELIDRYKVVENEYDNVVRSIPARDKKPKSKSELLLQTMMSLAEIKALEWVEGVKERFFTCYADIVNIETEFGWNYISCQLCKRKVKQQNNIFWCNSCNSESQFLMPSYKLQIQVKDHTGTASFVLFDKDAEKIIQKTAMELSLKNQEPNKVPQEIQNLLGKSYTFQIKVDDYNVKEGWEVYTVTSVFKSESNKHSENIVADNIQIKPSETLFSHHQPIANNPIAASDIKLLTSLKDVTDDNLIDEVFEKTQLKDLAKKKNL
ncbi:uncharacterized protein LOC111994371 isoform X1 [Quercus suber]|uniref:uncharacterized protein LOC111994371 isoform X1 n=2 Tax=Quercus suber TaxID=58331 RepID=UPI0032DEE12A